MVAPHGIAGTVWAEEMSRYKEEEQKTEQEPGPAHWPLRAIFLAEIQLRFVAQGFLFNNAFAFFRREGHNYS